jgi:hypothetical protein
MMDRLAVVSCVVVAGCNFVPGSSTAIDASPDDDGGTSDAPLVIADADPQCSARDATTVALWTFDVDLSDVTGAHPGTYEGGTPSVVAGRCGGAIDFPNLVTAYGRVDDSPDWDLPTGSVELWFRFDELPLAGQVDGLLSRDATGYGDGHFAVIVDSTGSVGVRIQLANGTQRASCTEPAVTAGRWHHLGINFGATDGEVFVDRVLAPLRISGNVGGAPCSASLDDRGMAGNDRPWAFGGLNWGDTSPTPPHNIQGAFNGALDHVHVRDARRDFTTL